MTYDFVKRIIDIGMAITLLILFLPVFLLTGVLVKITSPGPIFADTPGRVGKEGKLFHPYKFRSMIANAYYLLRTDPRFKKAFEEQQKAGNYKVMNDPRITLVGHFIRKHSIDEIPQLLNVLMGEMSLVGPRPYYPEELELQQKEYPNTKDKVKDVLSVKPGVTGFWQVSGRSEVKFDKRIEMDAYYANNMNLLMDLGIILKTPIVMFTGRGAA